MCSLQFCTLAKANLLICAGWKEGRDIERFHEPLVEMDAAGERKGGCKSERFVRRGVRGKGEGEKEQREHEDLTGMSNRICLLTPDLPKSGLRQKIDGNNPWLLLLAAFKLAASFGGDAKEYLWEGLCEGARSRIFENLFCILVGHVLARLPGRIAGLLEWTIE